MRAERLDHVTVALAVLVLLGLVAVVEGTVSAVAVALGILLGVAATRRLRA